MWSSTDSNCRNTQLLRNLLGKVWRNTFHQDAKGARLLGCFGVGHQLVCIALDTVTTERMNTLWAQSNVCNRRNASIDERSNRGRLLVSTLHFYRLALRSLHDGRCGLDSVNYAQLAYGER